MKDSPKVILFILSGLALVVALAAMIPLALWLVGCQAPETQISCEPGPGQCYMWDASSGDHHYSMGVCCDRGCQCRQATQYHGEDATAYTDGHYGCYPGYAGQGNYYCDDDCGCLVFGQDVTE
jgi:hypothetical protein